MLARELSPELIREMAAEKDFAVSKADYLSSVLVESGSVEKSDVDAILRRFDELDVAKSGYLDQADLDLLARREGK